MSLRNPSLLVGRISKLVGVVTLLGAAVLFYTLFPTLKKEDPRTTSDKEGRYVPRQTLRQLADAMHRYHEKNGRLPPAAVCNADGKPLLSWRVLLLPYLEQEELFHEFKLDEPWDSPHNLALLPKMPYTYGPLDGDPPLDQNTTLFQVFTGKGTAFAGCEGLRPRKDIPRTSYTILIAEARRAVPWTKPADIPFDENAPLPALGGFFKGYFHLAMADGSTLTVRHNTVQEKDLRAAILRNGDGAWPWGR